MQDPSDLMQQTDDSYFLEQFQRLCRCRQVIAFLSSGSLISANMNPVGVNPLLISVVVLSHLVIAFLIIQFAPKIFNKKDKKSRLDS